MSGMKVIVLADDFTGTLDTGVQFAMAAFPTEVLLWTEFLCRAKIALPADQVSPDIVTAVDTESRHLPREAAYQRLLDVTRAAVAQGYEIFYKKTDSTLRGAIGAEMQAMLDALPHQTLHFLPAYPKMGRQTHDGMQLIHGIPLNKTEFATDPLNPVQTAYVPDVLKAQGFMGTVCVVAGDVNTTQGTTAQKGSEPIAEEKTVLVHNAREQADLVAAGERLADTHSLGLTAGCAGFATVLADCLKTRLHCQTGAKAMCEPFFPVSRQTLLLCGSTSETSLSQIRAFCAHHPEVAVHVLSWEEKSPGFWQSDDGIQRLERIRERLATDALYIIQSVQHRRECDERIDAGTVAAAFGAIVRNVLAGCASLNLIVFGGDTVYGVMNAIPGATLRPVDEITPGIVTSALSGEKGTRLMITKAGGFGAPNAVEDMLAYIRGMAPGTTK